MYGGRGPVYIGGDVNINIDHSKKIYNNRKGISTNDISRNPGKGGAQTRPASGGRNDVLLDKQGNVYKPNPSGSWQQLDKNDWKAANTSEVNNLNRQMENRERSLNRNNSFNGTKPASKMLVPPNKR
jgi:hypothetical protein